MALIGALTKLAIAAAPAVKKAAETARKNNTATGSGASQKMTTADTRPVSSGGGSSGGYKPYVKGEDPELDGKIAVYSKAYADARAAGDARGMREANDRANQLRNQYGYAATHADEDIKKVAIASGVSGGGSGPVTGTVLPRPQVPPGMGEGYPGFNMPGQAPQMPAVQVPEAPPVQEATDYSELIEAYQKAQTEKALAELKAAYDKNVGAIDKAKGEIVPQTEKALAELKAAYDKNVGAIGKAKGEVAPQYEDARNQAAARAALQRRSWAEQAAAMGLASGAAGQAELARQNALQGSLTALDRQESADLATLEAQMSETEADYNNAVAQARAAGDLELASLEAQRAQTEADYNNAIAQARASGDYELAQRLYQEKVRVDEANRQAIAQQWQQQLSALQLQQQQWENQFTLGQYADSMAQQAWQNQFAQDQLEEQRQEAERERLWQLAAAQAEYGDFSGFAALGLGEDAISNMRGLWQQDRDLALQKAQQALTRTTSGGSGGSSGSGRATTGAGTAAGSWGQVEDFAGRYGQEAAEDYIRANYKALGYSSQSAALSGWRVHQLESGQPVKPGPGMDLRNFAALRQTLGRYLANGEVDRARSMILGVMDQLNEAQATEVYNLLGTRGM